MVSRIGVSALLLSALAICEVAALPSTRKRSGLAKKACVPTTPAPTASSTPDPVPEPVPTSEPAPPAPTEPVPVPTVERTLPWSTLNLPLPKLVLVQKNDPGPQWRNTQRTLAGVAARATLTNPDVPMMWIGNGDERNLMRYLNRTGIPTETVEPHVLHLVQRYKDLGVVKGFITYHYEDKWAEWSLNIATSLAAPLMAVVCEEGFKAEFEAAGLTELYDARGKTFEDLANMNLDFNKEIMTMLSPIDGIRDFAVAAQTWVSIDQPDAGYLRGLDHLTPAGTIIGYPSDEHNGVLTMSKNKGAGLVASDWLTNLPLMASGPVPELPKFTPNRTEFKDDGSFHVAFVLTDGDNLGFMSGDGSTAPPWWANPHRGKIPFTWGLPGAAMYQTSPDILSFYQETATPNDAFVSFADNYAYLDMIQEHQGSEVLTEFVKRSEPWANRLGIHNLGAFMEVWDSEQSQKAYDTIARAAPDVSSLLVLQYTPYSAGQGRTMYGTREDGSKLPILTSKLSIWTAPGDEYIGDPDWIGQQMNAAAEAAVGKPLIDRIAIILVHAWSTFQAPDDMKDIARPDGQMGGYTAAMWAARRFNKSQKLVTMNDIEDMLRAAPPA